VRLKRQLSRASYCDARKWSGSVGARQSFGAAVVAGRARDRTRVTSPSRPWRQRAARHAMSRTVPHWSRSRRLGLRSRCSSSAGVSWSPTETPACPERSAADRPRQTRSTNAISRRGLLPWRRNARARPPDRLHGKKAGVGSAPVRLSLTSRAAVPVSFALLSFRDAGATSGGRLVLTGGLLGTPRGLGGAQRAGHVRESPVRCSDKIRACPRTRFSPTTTAGSRARRSPPAPRASCRRCVSELVADLDAGDELQHARVRSRRY
jgi:hypothetical protein